jgi:hypothetical protein
VEAFDRVNRPHDLPGSHGKTSLVSWGSFHGTNQRVLADLIDINRYQRRIFFVDGHD